VSLSITNIKNNNMIDPKELRIGNLVEYNGMFWKVSEILSPKPLNDKRFADKYVVELFDGAGLISVPIDDTEPILITEEILLKAGFKQNQMDNDEFYYSYDLKDYVYCDLSLISGDKNGYLEVTLFPYESWFRYKYVHQIQNIYQCLCGKELEIKL
jgi:hypothetical protein